MSPLPARTAWLAQWRYAHRGLHGPGAAENSLGAAGAAIERGFGIECDIQLSADGQAMVFHDWALDRLTGETGLVTARPAEALARLPLTGGGGHIPRLSDLLALVAGQVPLLIEVKSKRSLPVAPACSAVARALSGYRGPHAVMSFDPRVARWFARHSSGTIRGLVVTEEKDKGWWGDIKRFLAFRAARAEFCAVDIRDLPSRFATRLRQTDVPLVSWTVKTPEQAARAALYVDAPIAEAEGFDE